MHYILHTHPWYTPLGVHIIGRAGASPPSRTAAIIFLYIYIYIYLYIYIFIYIRPTVLAPGDPALRANVAGQIIRASTLYVFIHVYICIRMYIHGQS